MKMCSWHHPFEADLLGFCTPAHIFTTRRQIADILPGTPKRCEMARDLDYKVQLIHMKSVRGTRSCCFGYCNSPIRNTLYPEMEALGHGFSYFADLMRGIGRSFVVPHGGMIVHECSDCQVAG
jgi:hypothetical protein